MKSIDLRQAAAKLLKNKYILPALLLIGLVLLLLPHGGSSGSSGEASASTDGPQCPSFSLEAEEKRLAALLEQISGAGEAKVLLSLESTAQRQLAMSGDEALVVSSGSGKQAVDLRYDYPKYMGAVIVCTGGDSTRVRLEVTEAVMAFTGLGSDRISVFKMK